MTSCVKNSICKVGHLFWVDPHRPLECWIWGAVNTSEIQFFQDFGVKSGGAFVYSCGLYTAVTVQFTEFCILILTTDEAHFDDTSQHLTSCDTTENNLLSSAYWYLPLMKHISMTHHNISPAVRPQSTIYWVLHTDTWSVDLDPHLMLPSWTGQARSVSIDAFSEEKTTEHILLTVTRVSFILYKIFFITKWKYNMRTSVGIEPTKAGCAPSTDAYVGSTTTEVKIFIWIVSTVVTKTSVLATDREIS